MLFCTATLAWGVNLPAHTVIIEGTELYDAERGGFVDEDILDIVQIFGRAGRPQFDKEGYGILISEDEKVDKYLKLLAMKVCTPLARYGLDAHRVSVLEGLERLAECRDHRRYDQRHERGHQLVQAHLPVYPNGKESSSLRHHLRKERERSIPLGDL